MNEITRIYRVKMNITQKYQRFKLHLNTSQRKIIQYTTRRDIRIQRFPDIVPAVNQDPVNINLQNQNY